MTETSIIPQEYWELLKQAKAKRPLLYRFMVDFITEKIDSNEVDQFLILSTKEQAEYIKNKYGEQA